jgi:hypothetical protein
LQSLSGKASNNINNLFNYQLWQQTEPLKLNFKTILFTKTDCYRDVVVPAYHLIKHTIIDDEVTEEATDKTAAKITYKLPGISLANLRQLSLSQGLDDKPSLPSGTGKDKKGKEVKDALANLKVQSNWIGLEIPGILYVPRMLIISAKPTYSKQKCSSSTSGKKHPLWVEMDMQMESVEPARSSFFRVSQSDRSAYSGNLTVKSGLFD